MQARVGLILTVQIGQRHVRIALCVGGITMDLDWLRDFLALADEKNFSRAADRDGP